MTFWAGRLHGASREIAAIRAAIIITRSISGERGCAHQMQVNRASGFAAFRYGPDHERLASARVPGGINARDRRAVILIGMDVAAKVYLHAKLLHQSSLHWSGEAHGEQDEIGWDHELRARDGLEFRRGADPDGLQLFHLSPCHDDKLGFCDAPLAGSAFFMSALYAHLKRPQRPRR